MNARVATLENKENFEIFDFMDGYFGICEKGSFGGNCIFGGDSACEDHYIEEYINDVFEEWDGEIDDDGYLVR